ncbi:MAG: lysylphosphatidylglycerol synthase transmembrane domain-containing protein [Candidatus Bipolaricaulota bacterium]
MKNDPGDPLSLKRKFLPPVALAFLVFVGLVLYGDVSRIGPKLARFNWFLLPVILSLTLLDDLLRFVKWDYFLKVLGVNLPWKDSAAVFFGGLAMAITPGKVGELFKSYLVKNLTGEVMSKTTPVVIVERFTDLLAVTLLASVGVAYFQYGIIALVVVAVFSLGLILVIQNRSLSSWLLDKLEYLPLIGNYANSVRNFYESSYRLLRLPRLVIAVSVSIFSWGSECVAMYLIFSGLGVEQSFLLSTFIFTFSSVMGAVSMLPGGLGVAEGSMTGIMVAVAGLSNSFAVAATLLIRLSTLWFAVIIGLITLLVNRERLGLSSFGIGS